MISEQLALMDRLGAKVNCSYTVSYNEHLTFYETAESYYQSKQHQPDQVSEMDWRADVWEIHVYTKTPVAFYSAISNSLEELLLWALELEE